MVTAADEEKIAELDIRPGTIPCLATVSHSLSHTQFWPKVETGLKGAFNSGKNMKFYKP